MKGNTSSPAFLPGVQGGSTTVQGGSNAVQEGSQRIRAPKWYEFEAATPVNQQHKILRAAGFVCCAGGVVVTMYAGRPPAEQVLALLSCVLYVLIFDPFAAVGAILARASRVILSTAVFLIGITIYLPVPGLVIASVLWTAAATAAVKRFNRRYLMQDTFSSARNIPDAIRTAPESKAGLAWRHGGAKMVNGLAAELGATCRDYAEVKARELSFYIGYQTADDRITELNRKNERLRLEVTMYKDAEAEKGELLERIEETNAELIKVRERANIDRSRLLSKIQELEKANAELSRALPEAAPDQGDTVETKLEYAFKVLHMTDKAAAEYAGTNKTKAVRFRKENGIEARGGTA